ncbi:hypothetical protein R70723_03400 [Paenibacillus sp. FSL R7-0273]|uniref:hypothetical protein n=1 Tax=Paenibacillus sp. FSL R7-0273 TaxID=1536772 RepID=UPI0004F6A4A0|nr:hypothetical protein [Paenibacillus sp. FSL R7-0273]AIQ45055.1 hypothetical protein R70723_03400 [Paenibacillus sp. FSL R7-0273]OMF84096.1 hypothetical protein BK144_30765 [Paenibacillus sp. FSL R7-0273]
MKKNAKVLLYVSLFTAVMVMLFGWVLPAVLQFYLHNMYIKGLTLLFIFSVVVLSKRFTWKNNMVYVIAGFTLLSMLLDTSGNPVTNKPLEWVVSPIGELQVMQDVSNYAPGEYAITDNLTILKQNGEVLELSTVWLYLYRFVQYLVLYSVVGTLLGIIIGMRPQREIPFIQTTAETPLTAEQELRAAAEMKRRAEAGSVRPIPPQEILDTVRQMKKDGKLIAAIKLVRQHSDMSLGEAKQYVEQL